MTRNRKGKGSRVPGFQGSRVRTLAPSKPRPLEPCLPSVGIIVGYAGFPRALRRAAISIIPDRRAILVVSNGDRSEHELDLKLRKVADRYPNNPILIFADMYGTSCCHAGARFKRIRPDIRVVYGVNLPMLVRFLQYRTKKSLEELVRLMRRTARQEARLG